SSRSYMFFHTVRMATQDSMLVLLLTLTFVSGWTFFERLRSGNGSVMRPALLCGVLTGCAVMTKSAAGLLPIPGMGLYAVIAWELPLVWRRAKLPVVAGLLIALLIPAMYFVPQMLAHDGAYNVMIKSEVVDRSLTGFHNQDRLWFYIRRIFVGRCCVPPEI